MKSRKNFFINSLLAITSTAVIILSPAPVLAQTQDTVQQARIEGISRQPTRAANEVLLNPNDAVVLLLDHQTGLFQTVNDVPLNILRSNTVALAKIA